MILAPMGVAAFNLSTSAMTIHRGFCISVEHGKVSTMNNLSGNKLQDAQYVAEC